MFEISKITFLIINKNTFLNINNWLIVNNILKFSAIYNKLRI